MNPKLSSKIPQYCEQAIISVLIVFIFTVPFVFDLRLYSTFDLAKITWMYLFSVIMLSLWVIKTLFSKHRILTTPYDVPILAYLGINILTTITSISPTVSLFGFYKRYEGLLAITNYIFLFYVVVNYINTLQIIERLIKTIVLAATFVSVYGIFQHLGYDPFNWSFSMRERVFATFGNPIFLSAYLMMVFPFSLIVYLFKEQEKRKKNVPYVSQCKKLGFVQGMLITYSKPISFIQNILNNLCRLFWTSGISPILIFVCFLCTNSRGPFTGFVVEMTLFGIWIGKKRLLEKKGKLCIIAGVIIPMFVIFNLNPQTSVIKRVFDTAFKTVQQNEQPKQEKNNIEDNIEKSIMGSKFKFTGGMGEERVQLWKRTIGVIKKYPILGIGPDTLQLMNIGTDKAHNDFLDVAVTRGLIGLFIYLWLIIWFIIKGRQCFRQAKGEKNIIMITCVCCVIGYLVQNQVSFGLVGILELFWITMGISAALSIKVETKGKEKPVPLVQNSFLRQTLFILIIVITCILIWLIYRPYVADIYYRQGFDFVERHEYEAGIPGMEKAVKIFPYENCYLKVLNSVYVERANSDPTKRQIWAKKAFDGTDWLLKLIHNDEGSYFNRGMAYYLTGEIEKAIESYQKVLELTNNSHIDAINNLGTIYANQQKYDKAEKMFKQAVKLSDNTSAKDNLRKLYLIQGKSKEASNIRPDSKEENVSALIKLARGYYEKGELNKVIEELKKVVAIAPNHTESYRNIASIYYKQGNYQQANIWFKKLLEINPTDKYAKTMIESIERKGK